MHLSDPTDVRARMVVYRAEPDNGGHIECFELVSDPYPSKFTSSLFVDGVRQKIQWAGGESSSLSLTNLQWVGRNTLTTTPLPRSFSLKDSGIHQNPQYNNHRLYDSLQEAMAYVESVLNGAAAPIPVSDPSTSDASHKHINDAYDRAMRGL